MNSRPIFSITGAHLVRNASCVLRNVNLEVRSSEILALVGPSGSGKSTLLRCMVRLLDLSEGTILFRGRDIREMDPIELRRRAVLVPQEAVMLDGTVRDNVLFGPALQGRRGTVDTESCLRDAGLPPEIMKRKASTLSGGERKRVALARALALEPEVLLLDEPTSGVDPRRARLIERTVLRIVDVRAVSVVWVTHHVAQARRVSDRVATMKDGTVERTGKTDKFRWEGVY